MRGFTGKAMTALAAVCVCTCYTLAVIFLHMFTLFIQFHFLLILSLFCVWESIVDWMHACMRAQLLQLCPTLYDPMDCSPPGSSDHGDSTGRNTGMGCHALLQGIFPTQGSNPGLPHCRQILYHLSYQGSPRILEWVAISFSRVSSQPRNQPRVSCISGRFLPAELPGKPL